MINSIVSVSVDDESTSPASSESRAIYSVELFLLPCPISMPRRPTLLPRRVKASGTLSHVRRLTGMLQMKASKVKTQFWDFEISRPFSG